MLQRIGVAQATLRDPELLFLDEPASGTDPLGVAIVRDRILEAKARGATIVLNSHQLRRGRARLRPRRLHRPRPADAHRDAARRGRLAAARRRPRARRPAARRRARRWRRRASPPRPGPDGALRLPASAEADVAARGEGARARRRRRSSRSAPRPSSRSSSARRRRRDRDGRSRFLRQKFEQRRRRRRPLARARPARRRVRPRVAAAGPARAGSLALLVLAAGCRVAGRVERRAPDDPVRGPISRTDYLWGRYLGILAAFGDFLAGAAASSSLVVARCCRCGGHRGAAARLGARRARSPARCSTALQVAGAPAAVLDVPARLRRRARLLPADRRSSACRPSRPAPRKAGAATGRRASPRRTCCPTSDWERGPRRRRIRSGRGRSGRWVLAVVALPRPGRRSSSSAAGSLPMDRTERRRRSPRSRSRGSRRSSSGSLLAALRLPRRHGASWTARAGRRRRPRPLAAAREGGRARAGVGQADPLRLHRRVVRPLQAARPRLGQTRRRRPGQRRLRPGARRGPRARGRQQPRRHRGAAAPLRDHRVSRRSSPRRPTAAHREDSRATAAGTR